MLRLPSPVASLGAAPTTATVRKREATAGLASGGSSPASAGRSARPEPGASSYLAQQRGNELTSLAPREVYCARGDRRPDQGLPRLDLLAGLHSARSNRAPRRLRLLRLPIASRASRFDARAATGPKPTQIARPSSPLSRSQGKCSRACRSFGAGLGFRGIKLAMASSFPRISANTGSRTLGSPPRRRRTRQRTVHWQPVETEVPLQQDRVGREADGARRSAVALRGREAPPIRPDPISAGGARRVPGGGVRGLSPRPPAASAIGRPASSHQHAGEIAHRRRATNSVCGYLPADAAEPVDSCRVLRMWCEGAARPSRRAGP